MTQWTITKDFIADPDAKEGTNLNAKGVVGPKIATLTHEQIKNHQERIKFRMKDCDGEVYYEGFLVGEDLLAPLDDFGTPNAGATDIETFVNGTWTPV